MEYTLPVKLTLENLKTKNVQETSLWNTGLEAEATGESLHPSAALEDCLPVLNTEDYAGTIQIPIYGNRNQYYTLKSGESIKVTATTDAEVIFYTQMAEEGVLKVTTTPGG